MPKRIVIVEDEPAIAANYADAFERHGYEVDVYEDRASALQGIDERPADLALVDVGLGDEPEGGFELCRALRARSEGMGIMFLTARDSDLDAVSGLRLGADDYLTKDISLPHLQARVSALMRRLDIMGDPTAPATRIDRGPLELDLDRLAATWRGKSVALTVTEFWIVHSLARHPGHVKSRTQLMDEANVVVEDSTVTSHIKRIRRKFSEIDENFDCVQSVYAAGYRWISEAT